LFCYQTFLTGPTFSFPTPPLNFAGGQKAQNLAVIFDPLSPLMRSGFKMEQRIRNLKLLPEATMNDLRYDILPTPPLNFTGESDIAKCGLNLASEAL